MYYLIDSAWRTFEKPLTTVMPIVGVTNIRIDRPWSLLKLKVRDLAAAPTVPTHVGARPKCTLGSVQDFYFDDEQYAVRYLIVKAGTLLSN